MKSFKCLIIILFLFTYSNLFGAGFHVNVEQGMKAMSLGGAFVGLADDPTAIYYNPAGITQLKNKYNFAATYTFGLFHPTIHSTAIVDKYGVKRLSSMNDEQESRWAQIPSGYITAKVNDRVTLGFAVFAPFGTATDWSHNWIGRYFAVKTDLKTYDFNPTIAIKLNDKLSFGFGLDYVYGDVEIRRSFSYPFLAFEPQVQALLGFKLTDAQKLSLYNRLYNRNYDVDIRLKGNTSNSSKGWGVNFGILFKPNDEWQIGAIYRSEVILHFKGHASYKYMPGVAKLGQEIGIPQLSYPLFQREEIKAKLTLPDYAAIGIANKSFKHWTFLFDVYWTGWSDYDSLTVKYKNFPYKTTVPKKWNDVWAFRFGIQYQLDDMFSFRMGYMHDESPIPDDTRGPDLAGSDRNDLTFGMGIKKNNFNVDVAYLVAFFKNKGSRLVDEDTGTRLEGKWETIAHAFGITVSYGF